MAREIGNIFVLPIEMFKDTGYFSFLMWVNCEVWSSLMIFFFFLQEMYILVPTWGWDPPVQQWETLLAPVPPRRAALSHSKPDQLLSVIHGRFRPKSCLWPSLVAQLVKDLLTMQETWVQSLGWEDPLEIYCPLQYCWILENPMDRGAWWVTVHGVAKSGTQLRD